MKTQNMEYSIRNTEPGVKVTRLTCFLLYVIGLLAFLPGVSYPQGSLDQLRDETLSYFKPLKGKVLSADGTTITSDLGTKSGMKKSMRVTILKEGVPFLHPVTREPLGRIETPTGKAEVKDAAPDSSVLVIVKGNATAGDILRISQMKVRMLFYQDRAVDWNLGDSYYHLLKETGRFELLDTTLDSTDDSKIMEEAKRLNADVALILTAKTSGKETTLQQRLLWVEDTLSLAQSEVKVDAAFIKELQISKGLFLPASTAGDALLFFNLPFGARLVSTGDFDGDGKQELIISTGSDLHIYVPGVSLEGIHEIRGSASDNHIRLDTIDINSDGRDEVIVTSLKDNDVVSYIYELKGTEFSRVWNGRVFLRRLNNTIIAQNYSDADGFDGPVYTILYEGGTFKKGGALKLPKGVNIYDFIYVNISGETNHILAYDDAGYLNLYNNDGLGIWRSTQDYGGFTNTFKKTSPTVMVERGDWSVKDRLFLRSGEAFAVKRIPLVNMAKGLGYKSSQIKTLWWTGFSMEERTMIDGISGGIIDYAIAGDRLIVLSKPLFGIKAKNLLKGENPFGNMLYIYSLKGLISR